MHNSFVKKEIACWCASFACARWWWNVSRHIIFCTPFKTWHLEELHAFPFQKACAIDTFRRFGLEAKQTRNDIAMKSPSKQLTLVGSLHFVVGGFIQASPKVTWQLFNRQRNRTCVPDGASMVKLMVTLDYRYGQSIRPWRRNAYCANCADCSDYAFRALLISRFIGNRCLLVAASITRGALVATLHLRDACFLRSIMPAFCPARPAIDSLLRTLDRTVISLWI